MPNFLLAIRTPRQLVATLSLRSLRVPTESGQAGVRPRMEPCMLALVAGLVLIHTQDGLQFCATAGGLLEVSREQVTLYTPFAALGDAPKAVLAALDRALAEPSGELVARRRLAELEQRIVRELHSQPSAGTRSALG
ncbi:MAG: hypothetical protein R3B07_08200 [Polyangiaceae bacterium]